jgi:hypothetical protein
MREQKVFRQCVCGVAVLLPLYVAPSLARASVFADLDVQASRDDNVGRAAKSGDVRNDASVQVAGRVGGAVELATGTAFSVAVLARAVEFQRFSDLSETAAGLSASLRHKFGLGPEAPWMSLVIDGERIDSDSYIRDGSRYGVTLRAGKRIGERWSLSAALREDLREGDEDDQNLPPNRPTFPGVVGSRRGDVFDFEGTELELSADYLLDNGLLMLGSYRLRDGDVVSSGRPNADIVGAAKAITADAAFGPGRSAYRLDALTHTVVLGLNYPLADTTALELDWEYQLSDADGGIRYDKNVLRLRFMWSY